MDRADHEWIRALIEKARTKLLSARMLYDQGFYEDAVSRAYYASFHAIQALQITEGVWF